MKTITVFRFFKDEVIALFPHMGFSSNYMVMSYAHVGQHYECDYSYIVAHSRLATKEEYESLAKELKEVGYDIDVRSRAKCIFN